MHYVETLKIINNTEDEYKNISYLHIVYFCSIIIRLEWYNCGLFLASSFYIYHFPIVVCKIFPIA